MWVPGPDRKAATVTRGDQMLHCGHVLIGQPNRGFPAQSRANVQDCDGGADTSVPSPRTKDGDPPPHGPAGNQLPRLSGGPCGPAIAAPSARDQVSRESRTRHTRRSSRPLLHRTRVSRRTSNARAAPRTLWSRRSATVDVSPLVAASLAVWAARGCLRTPAATGASSTRGLM
jgi:hypothetical protein